MCRSATVSSLCTIQQQSTETHRKGRRRDRKGGEKKKGEERGEREREEWDTTQTRKKLEERNSTRHIRENNPVCIERNANHNRRRVHLDIP